MVFTYTPGGFSQHPYGKLEEHLGRLRTALQSTDLPTETIESLEDRLKELELVARPNDVYLCGYPSDSISSQIASGQAEETDDVSQMLSGVANSVLMKIFEDCLRDIKRAQNEENFQEAYAISYCLGRLEGSLGELSVKEILENLQQRLIASRSKGGKESAKLKTDQDFELLKELFEKHNPHKRSKRDLCSKIANDIKKEDPKKDIGPKAIENHLVRMKLIPPPKPRSKVDS